MNITVVGAKDRELTNLLKLAAESFADKLLSKQLKKNINLKIQILDDLEVGGYCDCEENWPYPPRDFILEIGRTKKKIFMFLVLAHEMVHLKQMAKGEMKDKYVKNKYYKVWQGQLVEDNVSYWDQPWEIEAYGLENALVAKFLLEHDLYKTLKQKPSTWFAKIKREEKQEEAQNNN